LEVDEIENCDEYKKENGTCSKCEDGYFMLENYPNCMLIPPEENCLQKNKLGCVKCKLGYAKDNNECYLPTENLTHGC